MNESDAGKCYATRENKRSGVPACLVSFVALIGVNRMKNGKNRCTYRGVALTKNAKNVALIQVPHNIKKKIQKKVALIGGIALIGGCTYPGLTVAEIQVLLDIGAIIHIVMTGE